MLYLIYGNLIYFTGWVCEKRFFMGQNEKKAQTRETGKEKSNPGMCLCRFPVALVLFAICGCLGLLSLYKCANKTITTVSAIYTIRRGEQKVYRQENEERIALMENSEAPEVELKLFEIKPYLIFYGDTLSDEDPLTDVYKYYYKKEKIHVIP